MRVLLRREIVCQEAVELVSDYLEGSLSRRSRRRFERHIRGCPNCRAYLEQMRITVVALRQVPAEPVDDATRSDLADLYRRVRGRPPER